MKKSFKLPFFGLIFLFLALVILLLSWFFIFKKSSVNPAIQPLISSSPVPKTKIATLGILADVHSSWEQLEKAVTKLNQKNIDLVLVLGDLTQVGTQEDLNQTKTILTNLKVPYYIIPGNHDVWQSRQSGQAHDFNFVNVFGKSAACFSLSNLNLVLFDNSEENKPAAQADWQKIKECLARDQPLFFFTHEPLYHPANDLVMGKYSPDVATQAAMLRQDLCGKKAKLVVGAHLHSFSKYFYACDNGYQLPMLVAPAVTQERNFQSPRFLLLDIFADGSFEEREVILE